MTLPNFLVIGAHKAGTTSLYHYLRQHPQVFMPELKEARFFAYDSLNPDHVSQVPRVFPIDSRARYEALFDPVDKEIALGEASPEYLRSPIAARRIHEVIPDARIIVCLRDPVDRAYSEYLMQVRAGAESRSFSETFFLKDVPWSLENNAYFDNVQRFLAYFPFTQMHFVLFEDLHSDALAVARNVFTFLNVDDRFQPDVSERFNMGGMPKSRIVHAVIRKLKKNRWKKFAPDLLKKRARRLDKHNRTKAPELDEDLRGQILELHREDTVQLQALIRRDLSNWLNVTKA